jgi:hypothetical protein
MNSSIWGSLKHEYWSMIRSLSSGCGEAGKGPRGGGNVNAVEYMASHRSPWSGDLGSSMYATRVSMAPKMNADDAEIIL